MAKSRDQGRTAGSTTPLPVLRPPLIFTQRYLASRYSQSQLKSVCLTRLRDKTIDKHCPPLAVSVISPSGEAVVKSLHVLGYMETLIESHDFQMLLRRIMDNTQIYRIVTR